MDFFLLLILYALFRKDKDESLKTHFADRTCQICEQGIRWNKRQLLWFHANGHLRGDWPIDHQAIPPYGDPLI